MKRKLIFALIVGGLTLSGVSCMEIDNFDEPSSRLYGRIIDATTGQPILSDQGQGHVKIWEKSFVNAAEQTIPLLGHTADPLYDKGGTYNNNKLFPGTYDMLPEGAWWPADTVKGVRLGSSASRDFEVIPYLRVIDFEATLNGTTLTLSCRLEAPIADGLPQITDIRPFISRNQFCGDGQKLDHYNTNTYRINRAPVNWSALEKDPDGATVRQSIDVELKAGYTYSVRMGARVNDIHKKYNYSDIKLITIPQ